MILCVCCTQGTKSKNNSSVHAWAQKNTKVPYPASTRGCTQLVAFTGFHLHHRHSAERKCFVRNCESMSRHSGSRQCVFQAWKSRVCQSSTLDQLTNLCQVHEGETRDLPNCTSLTHSRLRPLSQINGDWTGRWISDNDDQ